MKCRIIFCHPWRLPGKKRNAADFVVISVIFPSEASTVVRHSLMFLEIAQSLQVCGVCECESSSGT